ncbi:MAG: hypothetical protein LQ345_003696 [Seirophora villosa]|nr:MAG: hypothetical protein LQ345_003696 [Seirophora villosa]
MSLPLPLPTASPLPYPTYLQSPTHPSLPLSAQTHHSILRALLKTHSYAPSAQKPPLLASILAALTAYLPHLFALTAGLSGRSVRGEEIAVALTRELDVEWRSALRGEGAGVGRGKNRRMGRKKGRKMRVKGVDHEVCFALSALALVLRAQARERLRGVYYGGAGEEDRIVGVTAAMRLLLQAEGAHAFLAAEVCPGLSAAGPSSDAAAMPETSAQVQGGLRALAMAEATLLAVAKDDPYPGVVAQGRSKEDREWMIKGPEIPKVRAHLFARLCIAAGEHAGRAEAMLKVGDGDGGRVDEGVVAYAEDLRRTARAKACRFFAVDDELGGETGRGIAWLRAAKKELGWRVWEDGEKGWSKGWGKLKKGLDEKREDRKLEKGGEWGADGGKMEEGRLIPPFEPLLAGMPSGREIHSSKSYVPPELDAEALEKMRAPPDPDEARALMDDGDDSSDEDVAAGSDLPGSFPGRSAAESEYY